MAKEALLTLQKFLEFARQRCDEHFGAKVRRASSLPPHACIAMLPDRPCLPSTWQGALVQADDEEYHDADTGLPSIVRIPPGDSSNP